MSLRYRAVTHRTLGGRQSGGSAAFRQTTTRRTLGGRQSGGSAASRQTTTRPYPRRTVEWWFGCI